LNGINGQGYETFIGWVYVSFCKVLVGTIGFHMKTDFSAENIPFEILNFNYKSPCLDNRKTYEKTLFSRKYSV
jgi:hypothetical protein